MRTISLSIFIIFIVNSVTGQSFKHFFKINNHKSDTTVLSINIENSNFFRNNEYFGYFSEGYTLMGYFLKPKIVYSPFKKIKIEGGVHLKKYSGIKDFIEVEPIFSIKYLPTNKLEVILGTLTGTVNHNLPDPVLSDELYLTENIENGFQLLYKGEIFQSDTWINWKQFILKGSNYPEIFLAGTSNRIKLAQFFGKHNLHAKLAATASHIGGQIDVSAEPVETFINTVSGLEFNIATSINFIRNIRLEGNYLASYDFSPEKRLEYLNGYGVLSGFEIDGSFFNFKLQHWFSEYYFTKFGNPTFQSISNFRINYFEDERALVIGKLFLHKKIYKGFSLGLGTDIYYNLYDGSIDYSYGVYIKSDLNYSFKKKRKK